MKRHRTLAIFFMLMTVFLLAGCTGADRDEVFDKARDTFGSWDQFSLETTMSLGGGEDAEDFKLTIHYDKALDERYVEWSLLEDEGELLLLYIYAKDEAIYLFNDAENQRVNDEDQYKIEPRSQFESEMPSAEEVFDEALDAFPSDLGDAEGTIRSDAFTYIGENDAGTWRVEGDDGSFTIETQDPQTGSVTIERSDFLETFEGIDEQKHLDWMDENN